MADTGDTQPLTEPESDGEAATPTGSGVPFDEGTAHLNSAIAALEQLRAVCSNVGFLFDPDSGTTAQSRPAVALTARRRGALRRAHVVRHGVIF